MSIFTYSLSKIPKGFSTPSGEEDWVITQDVDLRNQTYSARNLVICPGVMVTGENITFKVTDMFINLGTLSIGEKLHIYTNPNFTRTPQEWQSRLDWAFSRCFRPVNN